jgi:flavodoxin
MPACERRRSPLPDRFMVRLLRSPLSRLVDRNAQGGRSRSSPMTEQEESLMRALVVYESMFGNTQRVAEAITEGLRIRLATDLVEVNDAPRAIGADVRLLIVGGPTHAFGMSRPKTRQDAMTQAGKDPASAGIGVREWLESLSRADDTHAAAFDTHIDKRVPGSAARAAEKRLRKMGFDVAARAESFYVSGTPGPLVDGELTRARQWGEQLAASIPERAGFNR